MTAPSLTERCACLPDVAEGLRNQIHEFCRAPSPERAEHLAINLLGARRQILLAREACLANGASTTEA